MKNLAFAAIAALGVALSGCASIVDGTTQNVAVTSSPVDGAKCVMTSSEGTYFVTTPGNTIVHKTKSDLTVVCRHDGYADTTRIVASHFNGMTAGNVIAGGVIGLAVDAASGADYYYPTEIHVDLNAVTAVAPPVGTGPPTTVAAPAAIAKPATSS